MSVAENRVLREYLGLRGTRELWNGANYITRSLMIYTPHPILLVDKIGKNYIDGTCSTYGGEDRRRQDIGGAA